MRMSLLVALLALVSGRPRVGDPAPFPEAKVLLGDPVRAEQMRGRVSVVEFFASWCAPCRESLADILAINAKSRADFGLVIVAVEGDTPALRQLVAHTAWPARTTVALDIDGKLAREWGEDRLPTTFFVDPHLVIRHINRGYGPDFRARASRWLSDMLGPAPSSR